MCLAAKDSTKGTIINAAELVIASFPWSLICRQFMNATIMVAKAMAIGAKGPPSSPPRQPSRAVRANVLTPALQLCSRSKPLPPFRQRSRVLKPLEENGHRENKASALQKCDIGIKLLTVVKKRLRHQYQNLIRTPP